MVVEGQLVVRIFTWPLLDKSVATTECNRCVALVTNNPGRLGARDQQGLPHISLLPPQFFSSSYGVLRMYISMAKKSFVTIFLALEIAFKGMLNAPKFVSCGVVPTLLCRFEGSSVSREKQLHNTPWVQGGDVVSMSKGG